MRVGRHTNPQASRPCKGGASSSSGEWLREVGLSGDSNCPIPSSRVLVSVATTNETEERRRCRETPVGSSLLMPL